MTDTAAPSPVLPLPSGASGEIRVVKPDVSADGRVQFKLPIASAAILSVEVLDLDLVLVTAAGERYLLPQAALQAATSPGTTSLLYANGNTGLVADQIKKIGLIAPVEGGSYRIQASEIKPRQDAGAKSGDGFGLDKEKQDQTGQTQTEQAQESMAQASAQMQKIAQTLQNASASNAETEGSGAGMGPGKGAGTGVAASSLASATPSSAPNTKTSDKTADPNDMISMNTGLLDASRSLQHAVTAKVSGVALLDESKSFGEVKSEVLLPANPLTVQVIAGNVVAPANGSAGNSQVAMDFLLPGRPGATSVKLSVSETTVVPEGITLNGLAIATTGLTVDVSGIDIKRFTLKWVAIPDEVAVRAADFQVEVKFFDINGAQLSGGAAPITFHYDDFQTVNEFNSMSSDSNGNPRYYLPARGISYDINGTAENDQIDAGAGADIVRGLAGNDVLNGGSGNDTLIGGQGADEMDGGTGVNLASYEDSAAGVTASLKSGEAGRGGDAERDTLTNIQNLTGSAYADTLFGNEEKNRLEGGAGDDVLVGGAGHDELAGGDGQDTASYQDAVARTPDTSGVISNSGVVASLTAPASNEGEAAGDTYNSIENLLGSSYNDWLTGNDQNNRLDGGAGDDVLMGGLGVDALIGGDGTDTASYASAKASVKAYLLPDNVTSNTGEASGDIYEGIENLTGSDYNDTLQGDGANNRLDGGNGNDILTGGDGGDELVGGEGNDTASYAGGTAVRVNLSYPTDSTGFAAGDSFSSIENIEGSGEADTLIGNANANILQGGNGADTLIGGGGGDRLVGGDGDDTASYAMANSAVVVYLAAANQAGNSGSAVGDTYTSIENLTGSDYKDLIVGDEARNIISGGKGDDILSGGVGDVADILRGGEGTDTVSYAGAAAGVSVNLSGGGSGAGSDANGDQYESIENAIGTDHDDQLDGNAANNSVWGGEGNDALTGGGGNDYLYGEAGDDTFKNTGSGQHYFEGGTGTNTVSYEGFASALILSLSAADGNTNGAGGFENFTDIQNLIGGSLNDRLTGNSQVNTLSGMVGADALYGMAGNDVLLGGEGDDVLDGGAGADILNGEAGQDVASYALSSIGVVIDLAGAGKGTGDARGDTFTNIEVIEGSSHSDYILAGAAVGSIEYRGLGADGVVTFDEVGYSGDTVDFSKSGAGLTIDLTRNTASGGSAASATFSGIENLVGSDYADTLTGNASANWLLGGNGNDLFKVSVNTVTGVIAGDTFEGGSGSNTADYASIDSGITADMGDQNASGYYSAVFQNGTSTQTDNLKYIANLNGSAGNDRITGDDGDNLLAGLGGDDTLSGGVGNDTLDGGNGNDSLAGGAGNDTLIGGAGNNTLEGGAGRDVLIGGDGVGTVDTASYANSDERVVASLHSGDASQSAGDAAGDTYTGIENLLGSAFDDILKGDAADNQISGGVGNDVLLSSGGADKFVGDAGADEVSYAAITSALSIDLTNTSAVSTSGHGTGDAHGDVIDSSVETVIGGQAADLFFSGTRTAALVIHGGPDFSEVTNTVSYQYATGTLSANLTDISANHELTNSGAAQYDQYRNIQNLMGSDQADQLSGDENSNVLSGGEGSDTLWASLGNDTLYGGTVDTPGSEIDTVSFKAITEAVTADLERGTANASDSTGDAWVTRMSGIENVIGSAYDDTLTGDAGNNQIEGGAGDDTLYGGEGNDTLIGGAGEDTFYGGDGDTDTVSYANVTAALRINLVNMANSSGDAQNDVVDASVEVVTGSSAYANTFYGRDTNESLVGGSVNDLFYGSEGADTLNGGSGSGTDTVNYSESDFGVNVSLQSNATNTGGLAAGDILIGIERVVGSAYNDSLTAKDGVNTSVLEGGAGNDTLMGGSSNDTLIGGAGNDTLTGGAGSDTLNLKDSNTTLVGDSANGGDGNDTVIIAQSAIGSNTSFSLDGGAGRDTLEFYASSSGALDLSAIFNANLGNNFKNFEVLDLKKDGVKSSLIVSADWVRKLVDGGDASVLELRLGSGTTEDTYSMLVGGATGSDAYSQNANTLVFTNNGSTVAQVNFVYA